MDKSVSAKEMQRWIMEKTEEHFQEAVRENKLSFRAVDPDGDGEGRCFISVSLRLFSHYAVVATSISPFGGKIKYLLTLLTNLYP